MGNFYKLAFLELAKADPAKAYDILDRLAMSSNPVNRALERMRDAEKRGGIDALIKATALRARATSDAGKLEGIIKAIDIVIDQDGHRMTHDQIQALHQIQARLH